MFVGFHAKAQMGVWDTVLEFIGLAVNNIFLLGMGILTKQRVVLDN
jgi:hypothetical protein